MRFYWVSFFFMSGTYLYTKLSCKSAIFYLDLPNWEYSLIPRWCFHTHHPSIKEDTPPTLLLSFPQIHCRRVLGQFIAGHRTLIYVLQSTSNICWVRQIVLEGCLSEDTQPLSGLWAWRLPPDLLSDVWAAHQFYMQKCEKLSIMSGPAVGAKIPDNILNSCVILVPKSTFSFQCSQGIMRGCYSHISQFLFPHPFAFLILLHLFSACLMGDPSLIRGLSSWKS